MFIRFTPFNEDRGVMRTLTPEVLYKTLNLNSVDDTTTLSDIDDDFTGSLTIGEPEYIELPKRDFNIRTLTQKHLENMKQPDTWGYKL